MTPPRVSLSQEEVWDGNSAEESDGAEVMWDVSLYQPHRLQCSLVVPHTVDEGKAPAGNLSPLKEEIKSPRLYPHIWPVRERLLPCGFSGTGLMQL